MNANKAPPTCQKQVKLIKTGLPEENRDRPEEITNHFPCGRYLTTTERAIKHSKKAAIPANLLPDTQNILHKGHAEVTTVRNNSATTLNILCWYFDKWGAAKEITSNGAEAFCWEAIETFLRH